MGPQNPHFSEGTLFSPMWAPAILSGCDQLSGFQGEEVAVWGSQNSLCPFFPQGRG